MRRRFTLFNVSLVCLCIATFGCTRRESSDRLALLAAIEAQDLAQLTNLVTMGVDIDSPGRERLGYTPLMWAVRYGGRDVVAFLVAHGAEVDRRSVHGESALMLSVEHGDEHYDITEVLVASGADLKARDKRGTSVLERVRASRNIAKTRALLESHGARE